MESRLVTRRIAAVAIAGASALVIVGGTMAPVPTAHSASHHVHSFRALSARLIFPGRASSTRLLRHRRALVDGANRRPAGQVGSVSGAVQSNVQMRLPPATFPSGFRVVDDTALTPGQADNKIFSELHTVSYTNLGMVGGWFQYYTNDLPDGLFDDVYMGTYYTNVDAARNAMTDITANLGFVGTPIACSSGDQCYEVTVQIGFPDGQYQGLFRVVQKSNALSEYMSVVPSADIGSLQATAQTYIDQSTNAFLQIFNPVQPTTVPVATVAPPRPTAMPTATPLPPTPQNTPAPTATSTSVPQPSITVDQILFAHRASGSRSFKTGIKLRLGDDARFIVLYHGSNAGATKPAARLRLTRAGTTLLTKAMGPAANGVAGFQTVVHLRGNKYVGHLTANVTVTLGSASDTQSMQFVVTGKAAKG